MHVSSFHLHRHSKAVCTATPIAARRAGRPRGDTLRSTARSANADRRLAEERSAAGVGCGHTDHRRGQCADHACLNAGERRLLERHFSRIFNIHLNILSLFFFLLYLKDIANYTCVAENLAGKRLAEPVSVIVFGEYNEVSIRPLYICLPEFYVITQSMSHRA